MTDKCPGCGWHSPRRDGYRQVGWAHRVVRGAYGGYATRRKPRWAWRRDD